MNPPIDSTITKTKTKTQIGSTLNYIWYYSSILGSGATCNVYKGYNKHSCTEIAAKILHENGAYARYGNPTRELDVLKQIEHKNIVKLIAIENDTIRHVPVIIMELCERSLYDMLEFPINKYGLSENIVLTAISDISDGVQYLREHSIVHRDIKPNNIMCMKKDDGSLIFKLTDFGSSRNLEDDQPFTSLYGTAEYIHPVVHKKAVLRNYEDDVILTPQIDLWSIGATFYHIITGHLPYRPYNGRDNELVRNYMIEFKPPGTISAYQKNSYGGDIIFSQTLPKHCHISEGLRKPITSMLAGLMESKFDNMWSFKKLFDHIKMIMNKIVIYVFMPMTSVMYKIFVDKNDTYSQFKKQVELFTKIPLENQLFFFEYKEFHQLITLPCEKYTKTSIDNPLMLIHSNYQYSMNVIIESHPSQPTDTTKTNNDLLQDYKIVKSHISFLYYIRCILEESIKKQSLYTEFSKNIFRVLQNNLKTFNHIIYMIQQYILNITNLLHVITENNIDVTVYNHDKDIVMMQQDIILLVNELKKKEIKFNKKKKIFETLLHDVSTYIEPILDKPNSILQKWNDMIDSLDICTSSCMGKFDGFLQNIIKVCCEYKDDSIKGNLNSNQDTVHTMHKYNYPLKTTMALSLFNDHCNNNLIQIHTNHRQWFNDFVKKPIDIVQQLKVSLPRLQNEIYDIQRNILNDVSDLKRHKLNYFRFLYALINSMPNTIKPIVQNASTNTNTQNKRKPMVQNASTNTEPEQEPEPIAVATNVVCSNYSNESVRELEHSVMSESELDKIKNVALMVDKIKMMLLQLKSNGKTWVQIDDMDVINDLNVYSYEARDLITELKKKFK